MRHSWLAMALALACATAAPVAPAPGTSAAWGTIKLVPREGVTPGGRGGASYGDARLRDVEFVDYTRPGFAVVYVEQQPAPGGDLSFAIRDSRIGTWIEPDHGAIGAAGRVVVRNESPETHVLSYPAAELVRSLAPGEQVEIAVPRPGEQELFLVDRPVTATLFAAPGAFAVVSSSGGFELAGLPPGRRRLHAWHPRFPTARADVDLAPDTRVRVDMELGLGREGEAGAE